MAKRKKKKKQSGVWVFAKKSILLILLGFIIFLPFYLISLDREITSKFERHRWNLPSRIYSDSFPLYPGQTVRKEDIEERLTHLDYRKVGSVSHSGEYSQNGGSFQIYLHRFEYPDGRFEGYPIAFEISGTTLQNLRRLDSEEPLKLTRLEPELIASIFDENLEDRTFVPLDEIPESLIKAVIAVEDKRFYSHFGIDPKGITRAMLKNIKSLKLVEGGSTLTQQLIKNFFLHSKKTFGRKFNEFFMAILLERRYSKKEILEVYLNEIYFGQRGSSSISGVQEASRLYFSKDVGQLTLAESATLAGLIRSPYKYSPIYNPEASLKRRNLVLSMMEEQELISKKAKEAASKEALPGVKPVQKTTNAPFFVQFVQKQLKENFPQEKLYSEGLRIFTTLDMNWQRQAEKSLTAFLDKLEKNSAYLKKQKASGLDLEGSVVVVQPQTGFVKAYVGGRDFEKNQFDHITLAKRQTGSAFKPFVYLAALDPKRDEPYTLASLLDDSPYTIKSGGRKWSPSNYDNQYHGKVRLRTALEQSYNIPTVRLAVDVGLSQIIDLAHKAGIQSRLEPYPSLALGSFELTPLELATAYTIFPNQGTRSDPVSIRMVVTPEGEVLEKKDLEMTQVAAPDVIYLMNKILQGVVERGTAKSAGSQLSFLAAGKTGTTSDYRDSWFVGYTRDYLALTWVGYDNNKPTQLSGSTGALPIWIDVMKHEVIGSTQNDFIPSHNINIVKLDKETGKLYKKSCGESMEEYFIDGTEPSEKFSSSSDKSEDFRVR